MEHSRFFDPSPGRLATILVLTCRMAAMIADPIAWLAASGAQRDVLDGLSRFARDWPTLWNECPRGDWLLGIAARLGVAHVALVRAAIGCARVSEELAAADAQIAQALARSLEAAERWTRGDATAEDVAEATRALEAAESRAVDPSVAAAARAALAVGMGVTDRDVLAAAPAAAAEAQMTSAIDCGLEMAMRWAHDKCAAQVRAAIPWSEVEACLARGS